MPARPPDEVRRRSQLRYKIQFVSGLLILCVLVAPSVVHSAAAIATLRNLPVLWLPRDMAIRQDFFEFIETFDVSDTVFVSWPTATLDDLSVQRAERWLAPLSSEGKGAGAIPSSLLDDEQYGPVFANGGGGYPLQWTRSGQDLVESLTRPPVNLSDAHAAHRLREAFVGDDRSHTCLVMSLDFATLDHHRQLLPMLRQGIASAVSCPVEEVVMVGAPVDGAAIDSAAISSIAKYSLPSALIAAVLCVCCLRSFVLTLTIVAVAMVSQGMVLASIYYVGYDLNAVLIILPTLVFVLTISAGIHLCNYFREILRSGKVTDRTEVVLLALAKGRKPCFMSLVTTVVGLLSLTLVRIQPIQVFGLAGSVALVFSLAMLMLMLPGAMLFARHDGSVAPNLQKIAGSLLSRWLEFPLRNRVLVMAVFAILACICGRGLTMLQSSVRVPDMFDYNSDLNRSYRWFEEKIGPTLTGELLVAFARDESTDALSRLQVVKELHADVLKTEGVGGVVSGATFLPKVSRSLGMGNVMTRSMVRSLIDGETSLLYKFGTISRTESDEIWRVTFRLYQTDEIAAHHRLEAIEQAATGVLSKIAPEVRPRIALTGHIVVVEKTQQILLEDLVRSFATAFVVIAVFMSVMVGNPVGGLLSMIPNMVPTLVLFGMMGWCGYSLDIGSVMTASVALGIAVDDTLHLLSHFRASRNAGHDLMASARDAIRHCAVAMLQTTVVCGLALSVYYMSEFKPTQRFALFMGVLLTMAWLGVAGLLPAMMTSRLGRWLASTP